MQENDPKHTSKLYIKSKKEQQVVQLVSWQAQSVDLNSIELVWNELDRKSELSNPQVQLTTGNAYRKAYQNYLSFTSRLWWKECQESVKQW